MLFSCRNLTQEPRAAFGPYIRLSYSLIALTCSQLQGIHKLVTVIKDNLLEQQNCVDLLFKDSSYVSSDIWDRQLGHERLLLVDV